MAQNSEKEEAENDLESSQAHAIHAFLKEHYHARTCVYIDKMDDLSRTVGPERASDPSYVTFDAISEEIRNAMDHIGRASVIDFEFLTKQRIYSHSASQIIHG